MKKVLVLLAAIVAFGFAANAQDNAIGVRGAFGSSTGAELSFQKGLGGNRLELDLGWRGHEHWSYINLSGVYQWTWDITGGLGWYAGVGANLGLYTGDHVEDAFGIGVLGQIGLEYKFSIPLQISLDARPQWDLLGEASGFGYGIALGLRYCF